MNQASLISAVSIVTESMPFRPEKVYGAPWMGSRFVAGGVVCGYSFVVLAGMVKRIVRRAAVSGPLLVRIGFANLDMH